LPPSGDEWTNSAHARQCERVWAIRESQIEKERKYERRPVWAPLVGISSTYILTNCEMFSESLGGTLFRML
jgi:hypothetical protein